MTPTDELLPRPPALLFGIPIADVTMDETVRRIGEMVALGRSTGVTHQVATVNLDFLVNAIEDESLAEILRASDVCLADGAPIVWMAKAFGMPISERVAGSDLVPLLFDVSQTTGWRIHVFGSSPDVVGRAERLIASTSPGADVTFEPGPMISDVDDVDDEVLDAIVDVDADIVCVALGNPKQERFIRAHSQRIGAPVMIGIGGSIDMMVGERVRAPLWMQRVGLEWVARAAQEPRRLGRRYAHDIRVMGPRFASERKAVRRRAAAGGLSLAAGSKGGAVRLEFGGDRFPTGADWSAAVGRLAGDDDAVELHVDAPSSSGVSDAAAAYAIGLVDVARRHGRSIVWTGASDALLLSMVTMRLTPDMLAMNGE